MVRRVPRSKWRWPLEHREWLSYFHFCTGLQWYALRRNSRNAHPSWPSFHSSIHNWMLFSCSKGLWFHQNLIIFLWQHGEWCVPFLSSISINYFSDLLSSRYLGQRLVQRKTHPSGHSSRQVQLLFRKTSLPAVQMIECFSSHQHYCQIFAGELNWLQIQVLRIDDS